MRKAFKQRGLRFKLVAGGVAIILAIGLIWIVTGAIFMSRLSNASSINDDATQVHTLVDHSLELKGDFMTNDIYTDEFFKTGEGENLKQLKKVLSELDRATASLQNVTSGQMKESSVRARSSIKKYEKDISALAAAFLERGFKDWGFEGALRAAALDAEAKILATGNVGLENALLTLRKAEKDYLLRGTDEYLEIAKAQIANMREATRKLSGTTSTAIMSDLDLYEAALDNYEAVAHRIGHGKDEGLRAGIIKDAETIEADVEKIGVESNAAEESARRGLVLSSIIILVLGLCAGGAGFYFFAGSISRPLVRLKDAAVEIGEGRLDTSIDVESGSEIGVLAGAFENMRAGLAAQTAEIRESVNSLSAAASQILATANEVAASAAETASAVSETATTVEEVRQTATLSSEKAREVSERARDTDQVSRGGSEAVGLAIERMNNIREQMGSIAESVVSLSEQSQMIGEIISSVNDLAEQSNLLAVNASIEAAKAGEQGKGFAVVALEVKNLAEQSKQATQQVRSILSDIQKATSATVMATEKGSKAVEAGVEQSAEAASSIASLTDSISESMKASEQIEASSREQSAGTDQIATAMQSINEASTQTAEGLRQLESAAQSLEDTGRKLKALVEVYRL